MHAWGALWLLAAVASALTTNASFQIGQTLYDELEFEQAVIYFEAASAEPTLTTQERATVLVWRGLCEAQAGHLDRAQVAFIRALALDDTVALPVEAPPKVVTALEMARAVAQARRDQLGTDAEPRPPPDPPPPTDDSVTASTTTNPPVSTTTTSAAPDAPASEASEASTTTATTTAWPMLSIGLVSAAAVGAVVAAGAGVYTLERHGTAANPQTAHAPATTALGEANAAFVVAQAVGAGAVLLGVGGALTWAFTRDAPAGPP
jgi:tetratricopeptide (TPR) repeat protein